MISGRRSFAILLALLLLVGQWPRALVADAPPDHRQPHCHVQTDGGHSCATDQDTGDGCHSGKDPEHCSQDCDCPLCASCSTALAAVAVEAFRTHALAAATLDPSPPDGLATHPVSPAERPPRSLLD